MLKMCVFDEFLLLFPTKKKKKKTDKTLTRKKAR